MGPKLFSPGTLFLMGSCVLFGSAIRLEDFGLILGTGLIVASQVWIRVAEFMMVYYASKASKAMQEIETLVNKIPCEHHWHLIMSPMGVVGWHRECAFCGAKQTRKNPTSNEWLDWEKTSA